MKRLWTLFLLCAALCPVKAKEPYQIKLHDYATAPTSGGGTTALVGKERQQFAVAMGEKTLRLQVQIPLSSPLGAKVKSRAYLKVVHQDKGRDTPVHDWQWPADYKGKVLTTEAYFLPGTHIISLHDGDQQEVLLAKRIIHVGEPMSAKADPSNITSVPNAPYDRKNFNIWTTKSIDDHWKPVGASNKIKAGSCITLFFDSAVKLKNLGMMRWGIYKILPNGREEYVNQKDQGVQLQEWRRLSYEECSDFASRGQYRIYLSTKDDADVHSGVNNKNYLAKTDLWVE
ncbi:MAG: hypothetical protein RLZZ502_679 [Pseudomonadota bacterium]|jgi:hypothetical protein